MDENKEQPRGLNILCIDGGGVRGLSSLLLLSEMMKRLNGLDSCNSSNPTDYFDVIAGSGTGGVSACMLGRLGMSVDRAIVAYVKLAETVFSDKKIIGTSGSSEYKGSKLRQALKSIVRDATGGDDARMKGTKQEENGCKTMLFAMSKHNMSAGIPTIFRSYEALADREPDSTIWEALYATMAHPELFKSIDIDDGQTQQSFVGGEFGCSNPISHVLAEVRRLYPDRHVSCILSIGAGHARTIRIQDPSPSQRFLRTELVLAMKNMATDSEREAEAMAIRFQNAKGVYYRLNVDQGMQDMGAGDLERLGEIKAHTQVYMDKPESSNRMDEAAQSLKSRSASVPVKQIDGRIQPQAIVLKHCPAPTSVFTGRDDHILQVGACINGGSGERRVCVVHGLGGAGKTQLALKTIELNRDSWKHVLYVDASSKQAIESTLKDFATSKGLGETHTDTLGWLESCRDPWLVVLDNADDPSLNIHEYFPSGNRGSILITTRLPDLAVHARGPDSACHISSMSHEDGLALLLKVARIEVQGTAESEMEAANALLKNFGYLALAIVHAGAYIAHSPQISISKYRELFFAQRRRTLEQYNKLKVKLDDYGKSVYTTWRMCYDLLEKDGDAQKMLWLLAYLHYEGINEDIFRRAATKIQSNRPRLAEAEIETEARNYMRDYLGRFMDLDKCWDTLRFLDVISELVSYSLLDFDRVNLTYSVHVLVQDWARTIIPQVPDFTIECATLLLSQSIDWDNALESHTFRRKLGLHVDRVLSERRSKISANHAAGFAEVYSANGRWKQKEAMEIRTREARQKELGKEHPSTLTIMGNLASTYSNQGRWDESESLLVQVMNIRKRVLGEEHPHTLNSMGNLASAYSKQGRWDEAESLKVQVMNICKRVLGEEHPSTLTIMGNLALTYSNQGRWNEAESLEVQVINISKRALGEEHPDTLTSMGNLAHTYSKQGRWDEAESLKVQVMNTRKRVLGEEHPSTLTIMGSLASTYSDQGRWDEAESLEVQVMNIQKRVIGEEHPSTLISMGNLALTYSNQGRWDEAESLEVQVMNIRKRVLGEEHPSTLTSISNLAVTYTRQGYWDEAESLKVQVMNICKRVLGEEHPSTLTSMNNLASTYRDQGRWDEAESLEVQVMNICIRVLGEEHPDTLTSMGNLASTYRDQGRWDEAGSLHVQVMNIRQRVLGEEHPSTLISMGNLALTYSDQGRWDEAESLEVQVMNIRKRVLGEEHPDTLTSISNLAVTYTRQGHWDEAESLKVQVMDICKRVLGEEHPDTLTTMSNLAYMYSNQGRWDEAESLEVQVMNTRQRVLGEEHPDTLTSMSNLAVTYTRKGHWDEAESLMIGVVEARSRTIGTQHPDTLDASARLAHVQTERESLEASIVLPDPDAEQ